MFEVDNFHTVESDSKPMHLIQRLEKVDIITKV